KTVGRKIGFTNRNIWPQYGATAPIWAHVYDGTVQYATDDPAGILAAVEWMAPSFEIVDCHFADWKFSPPESAADFSFHWRLVVGTPRPIGSAQIPALISQLRDCRVVLSRNGEESGRGVGANALGHPASAVAHLVR